MSALRNYYFYLFFSLSFEQSLSDKAQMKTYGTDYNHCGTIFSLRPHFSLSIVDHSTAVFGTHVTDLESFEQSRKLIKVYRLPTKSPPKHMLIEALKYENRLPYSNIQAAGAGFAKFFGLNRNPLSKETAEHCSMSGARDLFRHLFIESHKLNVLRKRVSMLAPWDLDDWADTYFPGNCHIFEDYKPGDFEKLRSSYIDSI